MSSILHNGPDVATFAANLVVFFGAIGAAVAGALHAAKTIKKSWAEMAKSTEAPVEKTTTATQVVGGLLQDAYGSAMLAEQLRGLRESMDDLVAATKDNTREVNEARHATERLMDRMDRRNG